MNPQDTPAMNPQPILNTPPVAPEPFAESIIGDRPQDYDAVEVHPVCFIGEGDDACVETCDPDEAQFWSAYVHCKAGGVECIGDFPLEEQARAYADEIADRYGYNKGVAP